MSADLDLDDIRNSSERGFRVHPKYALALLDRVKAAEQERDEAIAHDRQPYPTAHAYEQACRALNKHRERADFAESRLAKVQEAIVWTDPKRLGGIPCIRGTRVPVDQITDLLNECSDETIVGLYPSVAVAQVATLRALAGDL